MTNMTLSTRRPTPFWRRLSHNVGAMLWLNWTLPRALRSWRIDTILCPNFFVPALKRKFTGKRNKVSGNA